PRPPQQQVPLRRSLVLPDAWPGISYQPPASGRLDQLGLLRNGAAGDREFRNPQWLDQVRRTLARATAEESRSPRRAARARPAGAVSLLHVAWDNPASGELAAHHDCL